MITTTFKRFFIAAGLLYISATPAFAHINASEHVSFMVGLAHPIFGVDHVLTMVAIGVWAALLGDRRAMWLVPGSFVAMMMVGFTMALWGFHLPLVEPMILASVMVLGFLVTLTLNIPVPVAMTLVGFFALFHGYAHGGEIGPSSVVTYALGFGLTTALLHGAGIALGRFLGNFGPAVTRITGFGTVLTGLWLALGT